MYTIYLSKKEVHITPLNDSKKGRPEFEVAPHEPFPFWEHFSAFVSSDEEPCMVLRSSDPHWLFRFVASFFTPHEAAGGLITNPQGQMLFIFRYGKWDLPKGHPEPGETAGETALREVEEECGVNQLSILSPLPSTYHAFPWKDDLWALKKTNWFLMTTPSTKTPSPQEKEGITRAEWFEKDKLPEIFGNAFGSVRELVGNALREKRI